jgi:maltose O-acetyltransferase
MNLLHFCYWTYIGFVNLAGHIGIPFIRHSLYRLYRIGLPRDSVIFGGARWFYPWRVKIGHHTFIGDHAFLDGRKWLTIGSNVSIATEVRIFSLEHDIESPTFGVKGGPVTIGDYVYIGSRVTILPEVHVGEGAVLASGAVVTKDVEPWTMVGGVPAKYIRRRPEVRYTLDTRGAYYWQ